jgi:hypothetical protein
MSQSLENIHNVIDTINVFLLSHKRFTIQKVSSSAHFLCLHCRVPGETFYLHIGRGASFRGVWISDVKTPVRLRIKDTFVEYARKFWRSSTITFIKKDSIDNAIMWKSITREAEMKVFFFWRGRDLFFAQALLKNDEAILFRSWDGKVVLDNGVFEQLECNEVFSNIGYGQKVGDLKYFDINNYLENETGKSNSKAKQKKSLKKVNKLKENLLKELNAIEKGINLLDHQADDLEDAKSVGDGRFKVSFRGIEGHFKKRDHLYSQIKKWKASKNIILSRTKELAVKITNESKVEISEDHVVYNKVISPVWGYQKITQKVEKKENYITFKYNEFTCFVGRNSGENDYLRSKVSQKKDLWVHVENMPSGHLYIRGRKPDIDELAVLTSALIDLCKMRLDEIPIIFTQAANLKGVKGKRGAVTFKKEKRLTVLFDRVWRQKISSIDEIEKFLENVDEL